MGNGTDGANATIINGTGGCALLISQSGVRVTDLQAMGAGTEPGVRIISGGCELARVLSQGNAIGLELLGSSDNRIVDCDLSNNTESGLVLRTGSHRNAVINTSCDRNAYGAVVEGGCDDDRFEECAFDRQQVGVDLRGARALLLNCTANGNSWRGIDVPSATDLELTGCDVLANKNDHAVYLGSGVDGATLSGCDIANNDKRGIYVDGATGVLINDSSVVGNKGDGITVLGTIGTVVEGNTVIDNLDHAIVLDGARGAIVRDNSVSWNRYGILLVATKGSDVFRNNVSENTEVGIWLDRACSGNLVHNNTVLKNGVTGTGLRDGVRVSASASAADLVHDNVLENNTMAGNSVTVELATAYIRDNLFRFNTFKGSLTCGVASAAPNGPNAFHHNAFIDNAAQVSAANAGDAYDDGREGNYWSDYVARYPNAKAVGRVWDTPYEVRATTVYDRYPLKTPHDTTPPVARAGGDRTVAQNVTRTFDGGLSTDEWGVANYTWRLTYGGDALAFFGVSFDFTFVELGKFKLELWARDAWDNTGYDLAQVTVVDATPPVAVAGPDVTVGMGRAFTLDGSASRDNIRIDTFRWVVDKGGLGLGHEGAVAQFTIQQPGDYLAVLNVTDWVGLSSEDSLVVHVRDTETPVARAGPDVEAALGERVAFDGRASRDNAGIVSWDWSFVEGGRAVHLQGAQAAHAFEASGTYVVTLNVTDAAGLWATDTIVVHVRDAEPPQAVAGTGATVDQHTRVTLDASGSTDNVGITGYTWTFDYNGSRRTMSGAVVEFLFDEAGSFQVTLTVEDADGNRATDITSVNVRDTTPPAVDAGGDRTVALGAEITLGAGSSRDNIGIKRFEWNVSGGAVPVGGSTYRFTALGTFPATLTVWDLAGNEASATVTITVRDRTPPVAAAGPDRTAIEGEPVALDGSGSTDNVGVAAMFWTFDLGGLAQNVSGPVLAWTFDAAGTYAVTLHVLDAEGNAATDGAVVTVLSVLVTWRIGPFLDGGGGTVVGGANVTVTLNGTAYNGTTDPYGSLSLQVKRRDLVSPAKVVVTKPGWTPLVLTVPLDAGGMPVGVLPPMVREAEARGGMSGPIVAAVIAVVAAAVIVALVLWQRRKGKDGDRT